MEGHVRPASPQRLGLPGRREVGRDGLDRAGEAGGRRRCDDIDQRQSGEVMGPDPPGLDQPVGQFASDHSGRADHQTLHGLKAFLFDRMPDGAVVRDRRCPGTSSARVFAPLQNCLSSRLPANAVCRNVMLSVDSHMRPLVWWLGH